MFDEDWDVFFYDEETNCVSSLTKYHAENCSIEPLVEAHPDVIYFYAKLELHKEFDFNQVAMPAVDPDAPTLFDIGVDRGSLFLYNDEPLPLFTLPETVPLGEGMTVLVDARWFDTSRVDFDKSSKPPCPSCDHDLSYPGAPGHTCYTYEEWSKNIEKNGKPEKPEGDDPRAGREIPPLM